jgi:Skp family chaperone for outer membrane proteins
MVRGWLRSYLVRRFSLYVLVTAMSAVLIGVAATPAPAVAQNQNSSSKILVLDVEKVLREYGKFKNLRDGMKADVEARQKEVVEIQNKIKSLAEQAKTVKDAPSRELLEKQARDLSFEGEKKQQKYAQEFAAREVKMFNEVYDDLNQAVAKYCSTYKVHVVLRISNEKGDAEVPNSIARMLAREVVYSHPNLDLTSIIVEALNAAAGGAEQVPQQAAGEDDRKQR